MKTPDAISGFLSEGQSNILVRPHWILLLSGALFFALAIVASLIAWQTYVDLKSATSFLILPGVIVFFAGAVAAHFALASAMRLVTYYFSYLLITPEYVVTLTGIARHVRPLETERVELPGVDETLLGRLLGYGFPQITGTGGTQLASFPIANPHQVLKHLQELTR
ncbi:YdbT family protein [Marinobacter shengliensis]|uniref:hypothetical protein n=1 Tax=Marinobacter shengliensis TaxID=1389223 RepID=UPI00110855C7|nr:hypothetical protein [Marinobacter shengliensis]